jgi:hypothetical protein
VLTSRGLPGAAKGIDMTDSIFRDGEVEDELLGIGILEDLDCRVLMAEVISGLTDKGQMNLCYSWGAKDVW